jgi:hypothetical protein
MLAELFQERLPFVSGSGIGAVHGAGDLPGVVDHRSLEHCSAAKIVGVVKGLT